MSKRIVMSILSAIAMSIGGFFVSCGSGGDTGPSAVIVQLPEGCTLISPRDQLSALGGSVPMATVKPGKNEFVISCEGKMVQVDKQVAKDQQTVTFSDDELR